MEKLIDYGWAAIVALLSVIWVLLTSRIKRNEDDVKALWKKIAEQSAEARKDRQEMTDALQKAMTRQAETNMRVAEALGRLRGEIKTALRNGGADET